MSNTPPEWNAPPPGQQPPPGGPSWSTNQPPPGYQPAPGYGMPGQGFAREHPEGTTILVLGILSLVICGILGPFAWSKGNAALREIDANPGMYTNRGSVSAGRICGIIASVLIIVTVAFIALMLLAAAAGSA